MRIRSIKPEWLDDEKMASASDEARLLSVALILLADDYGNGRAHPLFLASRVWSYGEPREVLEKLSRALATLEASGFVALYNVNGQQYFHINNWSRHQRVDHPGKPVVPSINDADSGLRPIGDSRGSRETLAPDLDQDQEEEEEEDRARADSNHPVSKLRTRWAAAYEEKTTLFWSFRTAKQNQLAIQLSEWIAHAAKASGLSYDDAIDRFIEGVFASELAATKKHRFEFVAACPEEFWTPVSGSATGVQRYRKLSLEETKARIDRENAELRARHEAKQKGAP